MQSWSQVELKVELTPPQGESDASQPDAQGACCSNQPTDALGCTIGTKLKIGELQHDGGDAIDVLTSTVLQGRDSLYKRL